MTDRKTKRENAERRAELVRGYENSGNRFGLVRLVGGSYEDFGDYQASDAGMNWGDNK